MAAAFTTRRHLTITNSTLSGNSASGCITAIAGGGIYNEGGTDHHQQHALRQFHHRAAGSPAAAFLNGGTVTITNSTLSGNSASADGDFCFGGGILHIGTLTITTSTLSGNSAASAAALTSTAAP